MHARSYMMLALAASSIIGCRARKETVPDKASSRTDYEVVTTRVDAKPTGSGSARSMRLGDTTGVPRIGDTLSLAGDSTSLYRIDGINELKR